MKESMIFIVGTIDSTPTIPLSGNLIFTVKLDLKHGEHTQDVIIMKSLIEEGSYMDLQKGDDIHITGFLRASESNPEKLMCYVTAKSLQIENPGRF